MPELSGERKAPIRIGSWWFHPELNRLRDGNSVIHLEPKAALVLQRLVERAGEPVTRQELLDTVWQDVVVSDDALTQVIIKLRKALGDSSRDPSYIQTIPKRGYCLLADVDAGTGSADAFIEQPKQDQPGTNPYLMPVVVTLVILSAAVILGYQFVYAPSLDDRGLDPVEVVVAEDATLTIMPFEAISGNAREQRFARGMHADLITDLAGLPDLAIINPSVSNAVPIAARYQVYGNVQQSGGLIGVHIRLVDTASQRQLWSQRYERALDDIFQVQRSISRDVVDQLAIQVSTADLERLASRYTPNLLAYEDFLKGQAELLLRDRDANSRARRWYRQAIEHDPNFARAYAGLALSYAADFRNHWAQDGGKALQKAQEMAQTGAQIDQDIAEVHWVLGYVTAQHRQHEVALIHLRRALEVDQSYADAYALIGGINTYLGRPELSIDQLRTALRLNQNAGYLYYLLLGRAYYFMGRYEQALINLRESLARNPTNLETHIYLLATAFAQQDTDTVDWEIEEIRMIEPGFKVNTWLETYPMTDERQRKELEDILIRVES
ncbi:transcriptional regulator [Candidatus Thiodiazotropha endoloripes]|uniref:transcriptional regulator n=1 Tax=Candidatus Thiodiazotropha endoloripes TaxID=1818881 RepID=UPI0009F63BFC|nr:transcriptional regulator [Candidatus Thiodiazotropha endoloripes]